MNVLILDFESTGLDTKLDRPIEIGILVLDTLANSPLYITNMFPYAGQTISSEITELTGITTQLLEEHGVIPVVCFNDLIATISKYNVQYLVAHNGTSFDFPLLANELARLGIAMPEIGYIDTRTDLPHKKEPRSKDLASLCFKYGYGSIANHRAVFDCISVFQLLQNFDFEEVAALSKIPMICVRAMISYEDRQLGKDKGFSWERAGDKHYPKCWIKNIKANSVEALQKSCSFQVVVL